MRVLQVIPTVASRYGGPQTVIRDLCDSLSLRGHMLSLVTTDLDGPERLATARVHAEFPGVPDVVVARTAWPRDYAFAPSLRRELRQRVGVVDVVHVHGVYQFPTWVACGAARAAGAPYVLHPHGALTGYHRTKKRWKKRPYEAVVERRNVERAGAVVVMTRMEEASLREWLPTARTVVVPPSIDASLFERLDRSDPSGFGDGIPPDGRLVTFLGRLAEKKGLDLLIRAFSRIARDVPRAHLVIAGPDDERIGERLRAELGRVGVGGSVSLLGLVSASRKAELLTASEVVVLPSKDESFGVVIAEALAVGTPVVVSPHVGLAQDVEASEAGLVVPRNEPALAAAIIRLLLDSDLRNRLGRNGRAYAKDSFSGDAVATMLERVYRSVARTSERLEKS